jgi:D-serine deaminase-like pyridoxal phosphate-dependent protein
MSTWLEEIETPCALIDVRAFDRNMKTLVAELEKIEKNLGYHVKVRPHFKAHKCPEIALRQLQIGGSYSNGVTAQKVNEVEALVAAGVGDILLSNEVVCTKKLRRLAALAAGRIITDYNKYTPKGLDHYLQAPEPLTGSRVISLVTDDLEATSEASAAAVAEGVILNVLVEIDVGQNRCGVSLIEEAVILAKHVSSLPGLSLQGIQAYHGSSQHIRSETERSAVVSQVTIAAAETRDSFYANGLCCNVISGGGTGTFLCDISSGVFNEVQCGSFALGDVDYAKNNGGLPIEPALFLATSVMSVRSNSWIVVDSGLKCQSVDSGPPAYLCLANEFLENGCLPEGRAEAAAKGIASLIVTGVGDEHTILKHIDVSKSSFLLPSRKQVLLLQPGHCDPFMNHYSSCYVIDGTRLIGVWTVNRNPGL